MSASRLLRFSQFRNFVFLPFGKKLLFLEAFTYLIISRVLTSSYSFKHLAQKLGEPMKQSSTQVDEAQLMVSKNVGKMVKKASANSPFRSLCFEQALTVKFMLNRRKIPTTIYFGVKKDAEESLHAHAWTRVGNVFLTGSKGKDSYTVISTFS